MAQAPCRSNFLCAPHNCNPTPNRICVRFLCQKNNRNALPPTSSPITSHPNPHFNVIISDQGPGHLTSLDLKDTPHDNMPTSIADLISALPDGDGWGPAITTETTLDGVPYAPFSKGDKLGRMADWTTEGKDGRDGRGGRQQYNRNYRGSPVQS